MARRPTLITLVGAWVIFGGAVMFLVVAATLDGGTHPAALLLIAVLVLLSLIVPVVATKRYFTGADKDSRRGIR